MNYCNFAVVKESDKNEVKISPSVSKSLCNEEIEPAVREENSDKIGEENTQIGRAKVM